VFIDVIAWENNLSNAMSQTRLQDKYNEAIRACDIFVALFCTKAGDFTIEEFHIALDQFKKTNQPKIFTYFKKTANKQETVRTFWKELSQLKHYPTVYKNTEDLHLQFWKQLEIILTKHESEPTDFVFPAIPKPDYFIGRDDLLANIHKRLQQDEPVLLMNGLGGIGKTAAAQVYANKYKGSYQHIASVFVSGDLRQNMVDKFRQPLGIEFAPNSSVEEQFEAVILAMQQVRAKKPNLLLLDNANDKQALINLKSSFKSIGWKVLVTSRCYPDEYAIVEVAELSPAEAMNLFRHYYPTESDLLPKLLEKIYHHTLMIELIAKAGKKKRLSIKQLLERLESGLSHQDLQREITVGSHADSQLKEKQAKLYQYILAMFEPEELNKEKQRILRYFSVLPAEDIPLAHLKTLFAVEDENQFEDDLESLFQSGWLSAKEDSYKMHALVQDVVFAKLKVDNANVAELIATLSKVMKSKSGMILDLNTAWDFRDYASAVAQKISASDTEIGSLNFYLADFYRNVGQLDNALGSTTQASRHFKQCGDTKNLTISYERLGSIHQALGEVDKALEFFELDIELTKELYESNPKSESLKNGLAISYSKLGSIHQALGEVDKALEFFELRMQLGKELYESNPKNVELKYGLAFSYYKLGGFYQDKQQAQAMYTQAIALWQALYDFTQMEKYKGYIEHTKELL
jgi:tetratricopeptide (TPR) repeat protein